MQFKSFKRSSDLSLEVKLRRAQKWKIKTSISFTRSQKKILHLDPGEFWTNVQKKGRIKLFSLSVKYYPQISLTFKLSNYYTDLFPYLINRYIKTQIKLANVG